MSNKIPPVKIGDEVSLGIVGFGSKGNPLFKFKNFIIYMEDFKDKELRIGEPIKLKITKVFKTFGFAVMI